MLPVQLPLCRLQPISERKRASLSGCPSGSSTPSLKNGLHYVEFNIMQAY